MNTTENKKRPGEDHLQRDASHTTGHSPVVDSTINPSTLPSLDEETLDNRKKTGGETLFDRVVYTGIGFGVNEGSALVVADQFEYGMGKGAYAKIRDWMVETFKFGEKVTKEGKLLTPHENAGNALLTFTLLLSGTALVYPMKWLEDRKEHFVRKANHWLDERSGSKLTPEEVATRDAEVAAAIACEPKQSWPSLLVGRSLAVASTMINSMYIMGPEGMRKTGNFSENLLTKGKITTAEPHYPEGHKKTMMQRISNVVGIETVCCAISSVVLETTSKLLTRSNIFKPQAHSTELCASGATTSESSNSDTNDSINSPEEKGKEVVTPEKKNRAAEIVARKGKDDSFASTAANRKLDAATNYSLGA
jgi:hypothetical protein